MNSPIARPNSSGRPTPSPFQNGILPGSPGAGETMTWSRRDLFDAPGGGAEEERFARAAFVDHLLVEFADARAAHAEEDAVQAAVGDRAAR